MAIDVITRPIDASVVSGPTDGAAPAPAQPRRGRTNGSTTRSLLGRVTIKQRLTALAVIGAVVFAAMTAIGVMRVGGPMRANNANLANANVLAEINQAYALWIATDDMTQGALNSPIIESEQPGITKESLDYFAADYDATLKEVDAAIKDASDPAMVKALTDLKPKLDAYHQIQQNAINAMKAGDAKTASHWAITQAWPPYLVIDKVFQEQQALAKKLTNQRTQNIHDDLSSLRLTLVIV
ncbi:MAG: hypothetical protein ACXVWW_14175, partial [Nocardioides sp.]